MPTPVPVLTYIFVFSRDVFGRKHLGNTMSDYNFRVQYMENVPRHTFRDFDQSSDRIMRHRIELADIVISKENVTNTNGESSIRYTYVKNKHSSQFLVMPADDIIPDPITAELYLSIAKKYERVDS